jgi:hypothetical protein
MTQLLLNLVNLQFLICGILAIVIACYTLLRISRSGASLSFSVFALAVSLWEFFVFLQRTASSIESTGYFFNFVKVFFSLLIPLYLLTILSIRKERKINILSQIPEVVYLYLQFNVELQFIPTDYGWSYIVKGEMLYQYLMGLIIFGYAIFTTVTLYSLVKHSPTAIARRKFKVLLWSFILFQAIGVYTSNVILALYPYSPPVGGFAYLLAFVFIAYSMMIKEEPLVEVPATLTLPEMFLSFLRGLYERMPGDELGQRPFKFMTVLKESGLDEFVSFVGGRISLKVEKPDPSLSVDMIQKTLDYMESKNIAADVSDHFLHVLNSAYPSIKSSKVNLLKASEDYLKRSDLAYGLADGEYIGLVDEDKSLEGEDNTYACLRIYKRLLLPVMRRISPSTNIALQKRLSDETVLSALEVNDYGEVSVERVKEQVLNLPKEERLAKTVESFNTLTCWIYEQLLNARDPDAADSLNKLKHVLSLNDEKAVELGITPSLLDCLSKKVPHKKLRPLYLAEGFSFDQMSAFSGSLGLTHEDLAGKNMLLEFKPLERYEDFVKDFAVEALANGEKCLVFTPRGSMVHAAASKLDRVYLFYLSPSVSRVTSISEHEAFMPLYDTTQLLNTLDTKVRGLRRTSIVLDNLSDLILSLGFDRTYKFLRHATEIITSNHATALFLLNQEAHEKTVRGALEGLFTTIMIVETGSVKLAK